MTWVTRQPKTLLYKKKRAFRARDKEDMRWIQRELKVKRARTPMKKINF